MTEQKQLKWGETIWDNMTPEQLKRECQRMYSALVSAETVIKQVKWHNPDSPYWQVDGTGGRATEKIDQIMKPIESDFNTESVYRSFFRYADDLLFDGLGFNWEICDKCGIMLGARAGKSLVGTECQMGKDCDGTYRKLEWGDLKPEASNAP